jgi:type I restriction enzyme M protein
MSDFNKRKAVMLPKEARYDELLQLPKGAKLGAAIIEAMNTDFSDNSLARGKMEVGRGEIASGSRDFAEKT